MGMVITLYLISANVYNSVEAPIGRGFSYIELWMVGTQFPILLALCEYGFILYLTKLSKKSPKNPNSTKKICSKFGCCQGTRPSTVSSMNSRQSNDQSATGIDSNQILNHDEPKPDFEERIRKLDFATMIFSFIFFIIFATVYWIVARNWKFQYLQPYKPIVRRKKNSNLLVNKLMGNQQNLKGNWNNICFEQILFCIGFWSSCSNLNFADQIHTIFSGGGRLPQNFRRFLYRSRCNFPTNADTSLCKNSVNLMECLPKLAVW